MSSIGRVKAWLTSSSLTCSIQQCVRHSISGVLEVTFLILLEQVPVVWVAHPALYECDQLGEGGVEWRLPLLHLLLCLLQHAQHGADVCLNRLMRSQRMARVVTLMGFG